MYNFKTKIDEGDADFYSPNGLLGIPYNVLTIESATMDVHWTCEFDIRPDSIQGCTIDADKITDLVLSYGLDLNDVRGRMASSDIAAFEDIADAEDMAYGQINIPIIQHGVDGWAFTTDKDGFDPYPTVIPSLVIIDFHNKMVRVTFSS